MKNIKRAHKLRLRVTASVVKIRPQTNKQINKQTNKQINKQTNKQINKQTNTSIVVVFKDKRDIHWESMKYMAFIFEGLGSKQVNIDRVIFLHVDIKSKCM